MKLILASGNAHKCEELKNYLTPFIDLQNAPHALEVDETGLTFHENAHLKAKAYFEKFQEPVIADDSGLMLENFTDILGVQSARFAPELPDYFDKCKKLLAIYQNIENRNCYFVTVICLYLSQNEVYFFEGRCQGLIADSIMGSDGFGYDPIFIPKSTPGTSYAQNTEWKNQFGHRAKASESLKKFLEGNNFR
jgi:XTP/dITP diphosphohydrolase